MGCDIHMVAQVRECGQWKTVQWPNEWFGKWDDEPEMTARAYSDRNYDVFAILADVRNGVGFAGIETGGGFVPIAPYRGFPRDFVVHEDCHEGVSMGDHSFTWLTLAEVNAYDWTAVTTHYGWIQTEERRPMLAEGRSVPTSYCSGVSGGQILRVTIQQMDEGIANGLADQFGQCWYARLEWPETCAESAGLFYSEWIPKLSQLGSPDDVRLVMGFDS